MLAEHRISPEDLVTVAEKFAAAETLSKAAPLAAGLAVAVPMGLGHAGGSIGERLLGEELEAPEDLRKKYLIHRLTQLLHAEQAKRSNRAVTEALKS